MQVVGCSGPLLVLGHLPEGHGEHYLSLRPMANTDVENYVSITDNDDDICMAAGEDMAPDDEQGCEEDEHRIHQEETAESASTGIMHQESYERPGEVEREGQNPDQAEHFTETRKTTLFSLPLELVTKIVKYVLDDDLSMIKPLSQVHSVLNTVCKDYVRLYPERVRRYNRLIYIHPQLQGDLQPNIDASLTVSVQKLCKKTGRHSGLMQNVRAHLRQEYKMWWTSWLVLVPLSYGWYRIDNVFWRRS